MTKRDKPSFNPSPRIYGWGMVAILLLAAASRMYALDADLPMHISLSQGATTDGPTTILAGRNRAVFGQWNPYGDLSDQYYLFPAMSWLSYLLFSMSGVGYWQANLLSVIMGLLAIVFAAGFAQEQFGRRVALFTALFMSTNYLYLMYNRTPMVYTTLTCGLALALYLWQKGLQDPAWFFPSGCVTAASILFVKILGLALLPAELLGLILLGRRRFCTNQPNAFKPMILFGVGVLAVSSTWIFSIYLPRAQLLRIHLDLGIRTFSPSLGFIENLRFAVQSLLQFGIRSGFFIQMLPVFTFSYLYIFLRSTQLLTKTLPHLALAEIVVITFLVGIISSLLASAYQPTRYLIVLIPPMSLIAGLALDKGLKLNYIHFPSTFSRWLLPFVLLGLTYFYYQLLASLVKAIALLRFQTGLADARVIAGGNTLFRLLAIALTLGMVTTLAFLYRTLPDREHRVVLPPNRVRVWIVVGIVTSSSLIDMGRYLVWAQNPQFSIVEASRRVEHDLGEGAILAGPYAYVLSLENRLPAILFYPDMPDKAVSSLPFTHVAVEADSILENGPFNDERLYRYHAGLMQHAQLLTTYTLRGYLVKIYRIER
jgi:hypothetical protein